MSSSTTSLIKKYSLKTLLMSDDTDLIDKFRNFLRMEFSDETLDFWLEVEDYKSLIGTPGSVRMAKRIYSNYIADEAPREINTERAIKDEIKKNLDSPAEDIFEKAQKDVFRLMEKGPFVRFLDQLASDAKRSSSQELQPSISTL